MRNLLIVWSAMIVMGITNSTGAGEVLSGDDLKIVKLFEVPGYCEGVVFDHSGNGYVSYKDTVLKFSPDGTKREVFAVTGQPNGHKILADSSHLVCDASHHAVLHLDAHGKPLPHASKECDGKPLRGPNDLTLDPAGGFYFTDPGESSDTNPIGTVHYVDPAGKTHLVAEKLAFPNGINLLPGGKKLLVGESKHNRVLEFEIVSPGKAGKMRVFADLPKKSGEQIDNQPDGMCLDDQGNLYVAHYGMRQVQVLSSEGELIARYPGGNLTTSNVAFGGPNRDQLYITGGLGAEAGGGGVFRIDLKVKGLVILPEAK